MIGKSEWWINWSVFKFKGWITDAWVVLRLHIWGLGKAENAFYRCGQKRMFLHHHSTPCFIQITLYLIFIKKKNRTVSDLYRLVKKRKKKGTTRRRRPRRPGHVHAKPFFLGGAAWSRRGPPTPTTSVKLLVPSNFSPCRTPLKNQQDPGKPSPGSTVASRCKLQSKICTSMTINWPKPMYTSM